MRKRRVRQLEFLTGISPEWIFHSWYTPKEHVFPDPITFSNLHEAFSSVSQFVLIQRWTALIQRKPALNSSETVLISAGFLNPFWNSADQRWNFWNLWNSAVQRWFALGLQPGSAYGFTVIYLLINISKWDIIEIVGGGRHPDSITVQFFEFVPGAFNLTMSMCRCEENQLLIYCDKLLAFISCFWWFKGVSNFLTEPMSAFFKPSIDVCPALEYFIDSFK